MSSLDGAATRSWYREFDNLSQEANDSRSTLHDEHISDYSGARRITALPTVSYDGMYSRRMHLNDTDNYCEDIALTDAGSGGVEQSDQQFSKESSQYIQGWRLAFLLFGVSLCIFLPNLEVAIVSTTLVAISNDLHGFKQIGWIVVAYLITYTGFIIIWAKFSDIFKRKWSLMTSLFLFMAASGGCGGAQSMTTLIVLRAFQGIGAAGCFSISMVIFFELIPKEKYPKYGAIVSADVALASLLGPLFGGIIVDQTTWRWVFLLNLPAGTVSIVLLGFLLPNDFPHHARPAAERPSFSRRSLKRIDILGASILIGANLSLVAALLEASSTYSWSAPLIIGLLCTSAVLWTGFVIWEWLATKDSLPMEPVFPFRFFRNRYWMGMLLQAILNGVPFTVLVVDLPQRFQAVNGLSALDAGVRLLPYSLLSPIGSLVSNIVYGKRKNPLKLLVIGAILQVLGLALMASLPITTDIQPQVYVFQAITGFGIGFGFGTLVVLTPSAVDARDLSTATGAVIQMRQMGGAIGLTIGTSLLNSYVKSRLAPPVLDPSQLERLLQTVSVINTFPAELQVIIKDAFAFAYRQQLRAVLGFAAAQFLAIMLMIRLVGWRGLKLTGARQLR